MTPFERLVLRALLVLIRNALYGLGPGSLAGIRQEIEDFLK